MSLLYTRPVESVVSDFQEDMYNKANAHVFLEKSGTSIPNLAYALSGRLYLSSSGWLLLSVPNSLVRGAFDALNEQGVQIPEPHGELPYYKAHITVMHADEVTQIGGGEKITERGHNLSYSLGPIKEVTPDDWEGVSKVWYITVNSPELQALRKSYGLTPKPKDNNHEFHITFAIRKKHVLRDNSVSKAASDFFDFVCKTSSIITNPLVVAPAVAASTLANRKQNEEIDEEEQEDLDEINDTSHLEMLRKLPVEIKPKKNTLLKKGNINGLLEIRITEKDIGNEEGRIGHNGRREEVDGETRLLQEKTSNKTSESFEETAALEGIINYYSTRTDS